jgi:hypothetical protein
LQIIDNCVLGLGNDISGIELYFTRSLYDVSDAQGVRHFGGRSRVVLFIMQAQRNNQPPRELFCIRGSIISLSWTMPY